MFRSTMESEHRMVAGSERSSVNMYRVGQRGSKMTIDQYVEGPPELVAEVAHSSWAIDLHSKRDRYERAGVLEYIVICLQPKQIRWFDFSAGKERAADEDAVFRSIVFPGLWVDAEALLELNYQRLLNVLNRGLMLQEHAQFVNHLLQKNNK